MAPKRLVVVGGGVAGLAGARAAVMAAAAAGVDLEVTVLEAEERLGGKVLTARVDGATLEWGPDSFLASKPEARRLAEDVGLGPDLVPLGPAARRTYLLLGGTLRPLPEGLAMGVPLGLGSLVAAVRTGILGPGAAARAAVEPLLPRTTQRHLDVAGVAARRLGRKAASHLVSPLVLGVFGAPADEVGLTEALPWASGSRSLTLAASRRPGGGRPEFLSIRGGMDRLIERLAASSGEVRTNTPVESLSASRGRFRVRVARGPHVPAHAVLLAVPAPNAARLLRETAPEAADELAGVRYAASAVVLLRFPHLGRRLDGSGYLVAPEEGGVVAACSWIRAKWPHVSEETWLRAVVTDGHALSLDDGVLRHRVAAEVARAMRAQRPPDRVLVHRWPAALPIYGPGHTDRTRRAVRALPNRIALAGAYVEGVGLSDCIRTGERAAHDLVGALSSA